MMKRILFFFFFLSVSQLTMMINTPPDRAFADTKAEMIARSNEAFRTGSSLDLVVKWALEAAQDSDITFEEIASPLAKSLMRTGLEMGRDGVLLAGEICSSIDRHLASMGTDRADQLRAISKALQGIRVSVAYSKLDANRVRSQIRIALTAAAQTKDEADQMTRVIADAFEQPFSETLTPPAETSTPLPKPVVPAPLPAAPTDITDSYDATASPS